MLAGQLMEAEITGEIGAGRGEVWPGRVTHRNGYRPCAWETRVGGLDLLVFAQAFRGGVFPVVP